MSKITEKLNRILAICEPVMTADRMQNVSIEVRDIKTILEINANKTMEDLLQAVNGDKKYVVVYKMDDRKYYLTNLGAKVIDLKEAHIYDSINRAGMAINCFNDWQPNTKFSIEEVKPITEPCKTKQELQDKMSSLIANGENISSETFKEWNEFVENTF